jgi:nitrite reductase/ring-hydroxylating ferredoxin subunit
MLGRSGYEAPVLNPEISLNDRLSDRVARNSILAKAGAAWQPVILRLRDAGGPGLKYILNGTFLGHPIHPVATDIPIGAWTVTALLDAISLLGGPEVTFASDAALGLGLLGGVAAIATGYADWADTTDDPRTLGFTHAALNGLAFSGFVASLLLRRTGHRGAGVRLAFASYGVTLAAAYLGGELLAGYQLGTKHTGEPINPPGDFVRVGLLEQIGDGTMLPAEAAGLPLLLFRRGPTVHAISGVCTHRGAPLREGAREGAACVRCPWHGSVFSLEDGTVVEGPASFPQACFETRVIDGFVEVRAPQR